MYDVDFVQVLQASIAPCVMISGVGLLLLSFSNRLSRPLDRIRQLKKEYEKVPDGQKAVLLEQIEIFYRRCKILRNAVGALTVSLFFISVVILILFISLTVQTYFFRPLMRVSFVLSILAMITGVVFFFWDVLVTLKSIRLEIRQFKRQ
ncbi:MAG: DUF2721 domain-containing protein [Candidatus Omnitrophota bacterium]|nr:DUF2721 domain-containing protein [Candidatus Omnitrophota bacterium]